MNLQEQYTGCVRRFRYKLDSGLVTRARLLEKLKESLAEDYELLGLDLLPEPEEVKPCSTSPLKLHTPCSISSMRRCA